jgi:hypothetical protein
MISVTRFLLCIYMYAFKACHKIVYIDNEKRIQSVTVGTTVAGEYMCISRQINHAWFPFRNGCDYSLFYVFAC